MRKTEAILQQAKQIIGEELAEAGYSVRRIVLFGSRARNEATPHSEWDFFVITDQDLDAYRWRKVATRIRRRFVQAGYRGDVFFQSEQVVRQRCTDTGYLAYYALREGREI